MCGIDINLSVAELFTYILKRLLSCGGWTVGQHVE